jgi:hypothetical protein
LLVFFLLPPFSLFVVSPPIFFLQIFSGSTLLFIEILFHNNESHSINKQQNLHQHTSRKHHKFIVH